MTAQPAVKVIEYPVQEKPVAEVPASAFDVQQIRKDFPILKRPVHGHRLVYLDSAATSQKPKRVIQALSDYYENYNANVHRGIHTLAEEATGAFEATRTKIAQFLGGIDSKQVIYTRGATEALNLVARGWGDKFVEQGDEILVTEMEHHANLVPWLMLAQRKGAHVKHIPIDRSGLLDLSQLNKLLTPRTKIVSLTHQSNVLGTINPVSEIAEAAHRVGAVVSVDGAQSVPHLPVNVNELGIDFLSFSSHKMLGPTGLGVLWGRKELLEQMDPVQGGGEMIRTVTLETATWNEVPWKFEAGTPNIADVIAFGSALDYLMNLGMEEVRRHDLHLLEYALDKMLSLGHLTLYGPGDPQQRSGVIAFNDNDIHPHDLSTILDHHGVAIRAGHHCAQPLMKALNATATARASFYIYNDRDDVDVLIEALQESRKYFGFSN